MKFEASFVLIVIGISFHIFIVWYKGEFLKAAVLCLGILNVPFLACLVSAVDSCCRYPFVRFCEEGGPEVVHSDALALTITIDFDWYGGADCNPCHPPWGRGCDRETSHTVSPAQRPKVYFSKKQSSFLIEVKLFY